MNALRAIYRYWISILALAVVVQIGLAGYGAFYAADKVSDASINEDTFEDGFGAHIGLGYLIFLVALIAVILALVARPGKRTVLLTVGAALLVFVQIILAQVGEGTPAIGALHPINAFIILGLVGTLAGGQWRSRKMGMSSHAAPAVPAP
jgi:heme A synthase